jgi:hypothetical protein
MVYLFIYLSPLKSYQVAIQISGKALSASYWGTLKCTVIDKKNYFKYSWEDML